MQDEVAALRCLHKAATDVCQIHPFHGFDLPEKFRPYSPKSYGIMPLISSEGLDSVNPEFVDMCELLVNHEHNYVHLGAQS